MYGGCIVCDLSMDLSHPNFTVIAVLSNDGSLCSQEEDGAGRWRAGSQ